MTFPYRTGDFGIVFVSLAVFVCLCYALACFASAAIMFFLKREHGIGQQLAWIVGLYHDRVTLSTIYSLVNIYPILLGLIIAGVLVLLGTIVAAFFPLSPIPGWVGFAICFCVEGVIFVVMLVLLWLSTRKGHYINLYLIASVITPFCMGAAFIGIFILLVVCIAFSIPLLVLDGCYNCSCSSRTTTTLAKLSSWWLL